MGGGGGPSFEAKFKQACTKPVQVWEGKYANVLKSNGWGGNGGRKWPKNWREREIATAELDRILGRQVLVLLAAKTAKSYWVYGSLFGTTFWNSTLMSSLARAWFCGASGVVHSIKKTLSLAQRPVVRC
jgi:hypothetical protein